MTLVLIRTCAWDAERYDHALELGGQVGGDVRLVLDAERSARETFHRALRMQGDRDAWHVEDDAILCDRFRARAAWLQSLHPGVVIQGFSRRKEDLTVGARWERGANLTATVCFFLPGEMARPLLEFAATWPRREEHRAANDYMLADFLAGSRYWLEVPNLADHRVGPSLIGKRAASRRSRTFRG